MTTMKITIEDMGVTKTYEKDFGEGNPIFADDFFETCLAAYSSNEYCNDIEVNIFGLGGNVTQSITWDKDNYIQIHEEMDAVDDLMSFLGQEKPKPTKVNNVIVTIGGEDVSHMFRYMGESS